VLKLRSLEQLGLHETLENEALVPEGRPEVEKEIVCEVPAAKVAAILLITETPAVTDLSPELLSAKSKESVGKITRLKDVRL
jgi:hypothetical protein